jgi:hypothetical protein
LDGTRPRPPDSLTRFDILRDLLARRANHETDCLARLPLGSSFEEFPDEQGILRECEEQAIKEIPARQIKAAMENDGMTKAATAARLQTSHRYFARDGEIAGTMRTSKARRSSSLSPVASTTTLCPDFNSEGATFLLSRLTSVSLFSLIE